MICASKSVRLLRCISSGGVFLYLQFYFVLYLVQFLKYGRLVFHRYYGYRAAVFRTLCVVYVLFCYFTVYFGKAIFGYPKYLRTDIRAKSAADAAIAINCSIHNIEFNLISKFRHGVFHACQSQYAPWL